VRGFGTKPLDKGCASSHRRSRHGVIRDAAAVNGKAGRTAEAVGWEDNGVVEYLAFRTDPAPRI